MTVCEREPDAEGFIGWYASFLGEVCPPGIRFAHFTSAATAGSLVNQLGEEFDSRALVDLQTNAKHLLTEGEVITVFGMGPDEKEALMKAMLLPVAAGASEFGGLVQGHDFTIIRDDEGVSVAVMIQFPILST